MIGLNPKLRPLEYEHLHLYIASPIYDYTVIGVAIRAQYADRYNSRAFVIYADVDKAPSEAVMPQSHEGGRLIEGEI